MDASVVRGAYSRAEGVQVYLTAAVRDGTNIPSQVAADIRVLMLYMPTVDDVVLATLNGQAEQVEAHIKAEVERRYTEEIAKLAQHPEGIPDREWEEGDYVPGY